MLLDDVMSELDRDRREALVEVLRAPGQAVITTTDVEHVPGFAELDVTSLVVADGSVLRVPSHESVPTQPTVSGAAARSHPR